MLNRNTDLFRGSLAGYLENLEPQGFDFETWETEKRIGLKDTGTARRLICIRPGILTFAADSLSQFTNLQSITSSSNN
jgi:hypothetical protein